MRRGPECGAGRAAGPRSPQMAGGRGSIGGDGRLSIVVAVVASPPPPPPPPPPWSPPLRIFTPAHYHHHHAYITLFYHQHLPRSSSIGSGRKEASAAGADRGRHAGWKGEGTRKARRNPSPNRLSSPPCHHHFLLTHSLHSAIISLDKHARTHHFKAPACKGRATTERFAHDGTLYFH